MAQKAVGGDPEVESPTINFADRSSAPSSSRLGYHQLRLTSKGEARDRVKSR
jgi:hypothetical protein